MNKLKLFLEKKAYNMRISSLVATNLAGSGHPTSALSAADVVAATFFYGMKYDPRNPDNPNNDRFILSKGHASPILYAVYKELGIISDEQMRTYRKFDSVLEGHPTLRFSHTEAATGSLGMGLSIGVGMAKSAKMDGRDFHTYVLMGDGETTEGSIWEAAEIAAHYKLDNLVAIVDCNRLGQSTETIHGHHLKRHEEKWHAFGWKAIIVDGHDMNQIMHALEKAREVEHHPMVILAKTIKGKGAPVAEDHLGFHGKAFKAEDMNDILKHLETEYEEAVEFDAQAYAKENPLPSPPVRPEGSESELEGSSDEEILMHDPGYEVGEKVKTREAYGHALKELGSRSKRIISLDGEVKNSTFAEIFEKKYPDRFIQCFIAEQNMVSMGVGLQRRGKLPFISTFAAFFSRAHDQVRMAAVSTSPLRLVGSHAGVSIGEDGPSQMGLEDLAIMRCLPQSIVFYPSDGVSTHKLLQLMANYNRGISYMRTTRMATPIIYENNETFEVGGCKVLKQSENDVACIVGAGVTLHEALKAYEQLQGENINVAVIDLYSIKPIDAATLEAVGKKAGGRIITVEDHYLQGGLGEAVSAALNHTDFKISCLAVTELPRSGKPAELMAWAGIDAAAIVKKVKK